MKNYSIVLVLIAAAVLNCGCGMKKIATGVVGNIATDGMVAIEGESDLWLARSSSPSLIKTLEVFSKGNPKDLRMQVLLAKAYGQYAFGFLEDDMLVYRGNDTEYAKARERADLFYKRGRDFGIGALNSSHGVKDAANMPLPDFKKAMAKFGKKDVPALFWTAFNWACYLNLHLDDPDTIADMPRIQAMIDRVLELNPSFYYGSAHAFKGVIEAARPKMLGGNPVLANDEFKKAMDIAPAFLMTKVLYVQYYAKQIQDVDLFKKYLAEVSAADAAALPNAQLSNEMAKRRANLLLNMEKKFRNQFVPM